jgi:hypothetical protein
VNHASETELWVRISKKASGQPSVTWDDGVVVAHAGAGSTGCAKPWTTPRFCNASRHAARSDGRWASAYAGSATMVMPEDFLAELQNDPAAHAFYATVKRQSQFTIYHRLHSAKRSDIRQKRMAELLAKLARGERT